MRRSGSSPFLANLLVVQYSTSPESGSRSPAYQQEDILRVLSRKKDIEMSPFLFACVVTACLVSHNRIGALADATTTAPTPSSVCQLPPYNVEDLKSNKFWYANITSPGSRSRCLGANVTSCTFYFAFCQALTGLPENPTNCSGSAVCQVGREAKGKKFAYSMGQFQANGTIFQENNGTVDGGFFMEVKNGSKNPIDPNCNDTTVGTRVILVCDSSAKWKTSNLTDFITVTYDITACSYQITLRYDGACLTNDTNTTATASPAIPTPTPTPSTSTSSTSSVTNSTSSLPSTSVTNSSTPTPSTTSTPSSSSSSNATTVPTTPTSTATSHSPSTGSVTTTSTSSPSRTSTSSPGPTPTTPPPHPPHTTSERPMHPTTKQPTSDPDLHKIAGLTAGVVIFALLSFFLLLLLIGAVWYFKRGNFRYRKVTDED